VPERFYFGAALYVAMSRKLKIVVALVAIVLVYKLVLEE
jgi:hypothetical protein